MDIKKQMLVAMLSTSILISQPQASESVQEKDIKDNDMPKAEQTYVTDEKDSSFKSFMDYRMITDQTSRLWKLQQKAYTDQNGIRKIGDYYCVAMGSGISSKIGDKFEVELDTGEIIKVILADQKADRHTDKTNTYLDMGDGRINVVEFIVETESMPEIVQVMGDVSYMPDEDFQGGVEIITELS